MKKTPILGVIFCIGLLISCNIPAGQAYTMENASHWTTTNGWDFTIDPINNVVMDNVSSYMGQSNLLHYNDSSSISEIFSYHDFGSNVVAGRINFYVLLDSYTTFDVSIFAIPEDNNLMRFRFNSSGHFEIYDNSAWRALMTPTTYSPNVWCTIGIEFDAGSQTYKFYVNDTLKDQGSFDNPGATCGRIYLLTGSTEQGHIYIAWMDYIWDGDDEIPGFSIAFLLISLISIIALIKFRRD